LSDSLGLSSEEPVARSRNRDSVDSVGNVSRFEKLPGDTSGGCVGLITDTRRRIFQLDSGTRARVPLATSPFIFSFTATS